MYAEPNLEMSTVTGKKSAVANTVTTSQRHNYENCKRRDALRLKEWKPNGQCCNCKTHFTGNLTVQLKFFFGVFI